MPRPEHIPWRLIDTMRELHSRSVDGMRIRMLWQPEPQIVAIAVDDARTGHAFCLDVREDERAMDVFLHPFAYAERRRSRSSS